jgi:hypothetical protein
LAEPQQGCYVLDGLSRLLCVLLLRRWAAAWGRGALATAIMDTVLCVAWAEYA